MIVAIFAVDDDNGIGRDGTIPWPANKEDLKWFKNTTEHQVVVMGRNTWESPDMPKPLPKRINVVFSNKRINDERIIQIKGDVCEGTVWCQEQYPDKDVFIIGGSEILMQSRPIIERVFLTRIKGSYMCDTTINLDSFLEGFSLVNSNNLGTCIVEEYEKV